MEWKWKEILKALNLFNGFLISTSFNSSSSFLILANWCMKGKYEYVVTKLGKNMNLGIKTSILALFFERMYVISTLKFSLGLSNIFILNPHTTLLIVGRRYVFMSKNHMKIHALNSKKTLIKLRTLGFLPKIYYVSSSFLGLRSHHWVKLLYAHQCQALVITRAYCLQLQGIILLPLSLWSTTSPIGLA